MKVTLEIQNLKCGGCENTIIKKISELEGITNVSVNHEESSVSFESISEDYLQLVKETLSKIGYPVLGETNHLGKKATSYLSCAIGRVQK